MPTIVIKLGLSMSCRWRRFLMRALLAGLLWGTAFSGGPAAASEAVYLPVAIEGRVCTFEDLIGVWSATSLKTPFQGPSIYLRNPPHFVYVFERNHVFKSVKITSERQFRRVSQRLEQRPKSMFDIDAQGLLSIELRRFLTTPETFLTHGNLITVESRRETIMPKTARCHWLSQAQTVIPGRWVLPAETIVLELLNPQGHVIDQHHLHRISP